MATQKSAWANGLKPMPTAQGAEVIAVRLTLTPANAALNEIYEMGYLPEDHAMVDAYLDSADIDTGGSPAVVMSFGELNSDATDMGTAWATGATAGQTGGALARATTKDIAKCVAASNARKKVGIKVTTAAATFAAGEVGLTLLYRAATYGA